MAPLSALRHHSTPLDASGNLIPAFAILADEPIWLPWRAVQRGNGKIGKPPTRPDTGRGEGWSDAGAAVSYAEAVAYATAKGLPGVGIVLGARTHALGLVAVDLDDASTPAGRPEPWASSILKAGGNLESYVERSPSGRGFRLLAIGNGNEEGDDVEVYDGSAARFVTITGRRHATWPDNLSRADATITAALARVAAVPKRGGINQGGGAGGPEQATPPLADVDLALLRQALAAVPVAELSYAEWMKVGAGLHHQFAGSDEARDAWDEWSAEDDGRYDVEAIGDKWQSFGRHSGRPVTARAILGLAAARGWKQPPRDASAAFGAADDPGAEWPAPRSLDNVADLLPPERWVPGTLPKALEAYAANVAARIGADETTVLAVMLPILGALAPGAVTFEPRGDAGWRAPMTYYVAIVGPPGSVKSPILGALTRPVEQLEAEWARDHKAAEMRFAREVERIKRDRTSDVAPNRPVRRRRTTTNATPEGHARLVERTGEAIITISDELQGFFGGLDKFSGVGATGSADRPYWLSAFEGRPYHSDRADDAKSISVAAVKASIFGGVQPRVLGAAMLTLTSDGLAQRFVWAPTGAARMSQDTTPDDAGAEVYAGACKLILDAAQAGLGAPIVLTADREAKAVSFAAERFGLEASERLPSDDPLRDVALKSRGVVARLTAALHVIEWAVEQAAEMQLGLLEDPEPLPSVVRGETAAKALRIWEAYYWPAAVRTYRGATEAAKAKDVHDLAAFVRELPSDKDAFTASDAGAAINRFRGKGVSLLKSTAEVLEKASWLRRREQTGGVSWLVNPALRQAA